MPATTGMKTASATTCSIVRSKSPTTQAARKQVARFASIQGRRLRIDEQRRREDAVLLREAGEVVHVLRWLPRDHVDHVVDGDHAEHAAVDVGHRDREQVVARDELRDLLLVGVGARRCTGFAIISSETLRSGGAATSRRIGTTPRRRPASSTT